MTGLGLLLARARADRGLLLLVVLALVTAAAYAGAVPRLLDRLARASLEAGLEDGPVSQLGLAATAVRGEGVAVDGADPVARLVAEGEALAQDEVAPPLRDVLGPPVLVVDSVRFTLGAMPGEPARRLDERLTFRVQQGVEDRVALTDGRLPDGAVGTLEVQLDEADGALPVELPVHEVAMSVRTAEALGMALGDRRLASPDAEDGVVRQLAVPLVPRVVVELVGLVELGDRAADVWFDDGRLHQAGLRDSGTQTTVFGFAYLPTTAVGELPGTGAAAATGPVQVEWRYRLDERAMLDADAPVVADAARAVQQQRSAQPDAPTWGTGLDDVLDAEAARRATAVEVLALAAAAVLGIGVGLLLTLAGLLAARRRDALALTRGRGASAGQLLLVDLAEAALLAALAAGLTLVLLGRLLPGEGGSAVALLVAASGGALLVAVARPDTLRPLGSLLGAHGRGSPAEPRARVVTEAVLVLLAVVAVVGLRRRGVVPDGDVDPLVVGAPVLATLAVAVLTARALPLPLRALERAASRRAGLPWLVGTARAARDPRVRTLVPVVVAGVAFVGLAAGVERTVARDQQVAAAAVAVADVRVDAGPGGVLPTPWAPGDPDATVVDLAELDGALTGRTSSDAVRVVGVDAAALAALAAADDTATTGLPTLAAGQGAAPLVVGGLSRRLGAGLEVGDQLAVDVDAVRVPGRVAAITTRALGYDAADGGFVLVDAAALARATGAQVPTTRRLVGTARPEAVAAAARRTAPQAEVVLRRDVVAAFDAAPLAAGVRLGFRVAAAAATVATLVAVVLQLAATSRVRRREAAVLGAVGASARTTRLAALAEALPVVGAAALAGVVLALGATRLLADRLDLAAFSERAAAAGVLAGPSPRQLLAVVVAVLVVAAAGVVATLGRVDVTRVLREER